MFHTCSALFKPSKIFYLANATVLTSVDCLLMQDFALPLFSQSRLTHKAAAKGRALILLKVSGIEKRIRMGNQTPEENR